MTLPIETVLPQIARELNTAGRLVLQAPPGAGKTTRVPLYLLEQGAFSQKLVMLEPRRIAARAAAERMAQTLGEEVGQTVGYRIRGESRTSSSTRIEVVTEGILTRMIQSDPELSGIDCILFDEFHERSLHADLGLALAIEVRGALRDDLKLLVMSATLDAAPVAALLDDAPMVTSEGQAFDVDIRHLPRPWQRPDRRGPRFVDAAADLVRQAIAETHEGAVLVFLPGVGEITRVQSALSNMGGVSVMPLYGALPFAKQRAVFKPVEGARKVVLATSIAETSLTIPDVRVVVDCGQARHAAFDPATGMSRLVTQKVTRAEATQRTGRAGRVAKGVCYRMWAKAEEGALPAFPLPEIAATDLASLVLELANWGARSPEDLAFLTVPPSGAWSEAVALLQALGALDEEGAITPHGQAVAKLPVHPRLAHMLLLAGPEAAALAALIEARDPLPHDAPADLALRVLAVKDRRKYLDRYSYRLNEGALSQIREEEKRLRRLVGAGAVSRDMSLGAMLSLAYPDRIALQRDVDSLRYVLANGKGAVLPAGDHGLGGRFLVAADLDGDPREARIRRGLTISASELETLHAERITEASLCQWSKRRRRVEARLQRRLDALVLEDKPWRNASPAALSAAIVEGVRDLGLSALGWSKAALRLKARVEAARATGADMPDMSDEGLLTTLEDWLAPHVGALRTAQDIGGFDPLPALEALLDWNQKQTLDGMYPRHFTAPTGTKLAIDYSDPDRPTASVRLQELFGLTRHPTVGPDRVPLTLYLLSPGHKPVQTTADLPGFWATSYADVRKDMRGRYPKHPWPEDPASAEATRRAKPRKA